MSRLRSLHVGLTKKAVIETPLHLPTLTELSLEETGRAGRLEEFSKHLHIPAVVELVLAFDSPYHPVLHFPSFATPPVRLTKLTLACAMTDHVQNTSRLLHFLRSLAHLEDVTLDDLGVTTDFLDGLCVTYHVPILPCLQRLDIGNCELSDDEGKEKLLSMLESRSPIVGNEFGPNKKLERLHAARWMEQIDLDRWTTICTALKVVTYEPDD
ncbi:hypothetical protein BDZ89DRAFT_1055588 [Hymenopellis radicata]|nr:hypothetical protein BDZ89DRAFT_1055588 [Hymenopellis radicata]